MLFFISISISAHDCGCGRKERTHAEFYLLCTDGDPFWKGHALSARFDCAHGASLSAVWGSWAEYVYEKDKGRFAHYAKAVWGIVAEDEDKAAKAGIQATIDYFRSIGMPTSLPELGIGIQEESVLEELSQDATMGDTVRLSLIRPLDAEDVCRIFRMANR
ncbi:hypothetical protein B5F37_00690 [Drancourtella sp. An210]|nr:hypothetical protein B5F37_00690 [Drancourtella sp. An210]